MTIFSKTLKWKKIGDEIVIFVLKIVILVRKRHVNVWEPSSLNCLWMTISVFAPFSGWCTWFGWGGGFKNKKLVFSQDIWLFPIHNRVSTKGRGGGSN